MSAWRWPNDEGDGKIFWCLWWSNTSESQLSSGHPQLAGVRVLSRDKNLKILWQKTCFLIFSAFLLSYCYKSKNLPFWRNVENHKGLEQAIFMVEVLLSINVPQKLDTEERKGQILSYRVYNKNTYKKFVSLLTFSNIQSSSLPHKHSLLRNSGIVVRVQNSGPSLLSSILVHSFQFLEKRGGFILFENSYFAGTFKLHWCI